MKKVIALVSTLLILAIATFVILNYWLKALPPEQVDTAENALATKNLIGLAYINNVRINNIMDTVGSDPRSLNIPILSEGVFSELYYGSGGLKNDTNQIVFSVNGPEESDTSKNSDITASTNIVMQGQFHWDNILPTLDKYFHINALTDKTYQLISRDINDDTFVCPDERAKTVKQELYLYISAQWLIISTGQQQLSLITNRLLTQQPSEVNLEQWRNFRNQQLASIGILVPENVAKTLNGFTAHMVEKTTSTNQDVSSVFIGGNLNLLKRSINLDGIVNANSIWAANAEWAVKDYMQTIKLDATSLSPALAELLNNFSFEAKQEALITRLTLKEQDIAKLKDVFTETMSSLFSFKSTTKEVDVKQESIKELSWDYRHNDKLSTLSPFKASSFIGSVALIDGPLALQLSNVTNNDKLNLLELQLIGAINMPKVEGWWHYSKAKLSLKVDSVNNFKGVNMLRDERCVKDLSFTDANEKISSGFQTNNETATVSKDLRLKSGSTLEEVANIKGSLIFAIPTHIKLINLDLLKGSSYEQYGVRFYLNEYSQQSITYQVSGDSEKILEVRGVNAKGQVLNESYTIGSDDNKTAHFQGDIAGIQLVVATKRSSYESNFSLTADTLFPEQVMKGYYLNLRPQTLSKKQWFKTKSPQLKEKNVMDSIIKGYNYEAKHHIASWYSAPIGFVILHDNNSSWGSPKLQSAVPLIHELGFNLQAVEVWIEHNDEKVVNYIGYSPGHVINKDQSIGRLMPHETVDGSGYLIDNTDLKFAIKSPEKLNDLSGKIIINLPKVITPLNIGKPTFTSPFSIQGVEVNLININNGFIPSYKYKVKAPNFINMIAVLDDGKELLPSQKPTFENGYWELQYPLTQKIKRFEILMATEQEQITYPFNVTPSYP